MENILRRLVGLAVLATGLYLLWLSAFAVAGTDYLLARPLTFTVFAFGSWIILSVIALGVMISNRKHPVNRLALLAVLVMLTLDMNTKVHIIQYFTFPAGIMMLIFLWAPTAALDWLMTSH